MRRSKTTYYQNQKIIAVINSIQQAVQVFDSTLKGKTFLYVYNGKYIEVVYRTKDFLHLTGVDTSLSAGKFYELAKSGKLSSGQIFFSNRHPFALCQKKLSQLLNIICIINSPILILEDLTTQTHTFKFGLTELNFTVCVDPDTDQNGNVVSNYYIARSLRVEDSFPRGADAFEVNFIFSKANDKAIYDCLTYKDTDKNITDLPESILNKISDNLK